MPWNPMRVQQFANQAKINLIQEVVMLEKLNKFREP